MNLQIGEMLKIDIKFNIHTNHIILINPHSGLIASVQHPAAYLFVYNLF